MSFRIVPLDPTVHDRHLFSSGSYPLDSYFSSLVTQDVRRRISACFVAVSDSGQLAGFYTLSAASVAFDLLPDSFRRKLPRYPSLPAYRLGRLAVDVHFQRFGLGGALLFDALKRANSASIPASFLLVDAINDAAASFYLHHGFISLIDSPRTLFLPVTSILSRV